MNSINFFNEKKKFPLSTEVLNFLQEIAKQAHVLANIGGADKYILTGCVNTSGTWSPGYVVVNGEVLPFLGGTGTSESLVRIKQTTTDIVAEYDTYTDALTTRVVEFGSNLGNVNTFTWGDFPRAKTNRELELEYATKAELDALSSLVMPKGGIIMWSGSVSALPAGFALCNGATVEGYGAVPDLRGRFIVGYDERTNNLPSDVSDQRNPDGTVVKNYAVVGNKGGKPEVLLSPAQSGIPAHTHPVDTTTLTESNSGQGVTFARNWKGSSAQNINTAANTGQSASETHENRPPYFVLAYIIKVV